MNHCKYRHIQRPDKIKSNEARNANSQTHRQIVNKPPGQPDLFGREMKANGKILTQAFKTSIMDVKQELGPSLQNTFMNYMKVFPRGI